MSEIGKLNEGDIMQMMGEGTKKETLKPSSVFLTDTIEDESRLRNIIFIGCGDGGCNITSEVAKNIDNAFTIHYNTSSRNMDSRTGDVKMGPWEDEDGSGKSRQYSKNLFKAGSYKALLKKVSEAMTKTQYEYIFVCATTDGGTGSGISPMVAKLIQDNVDIPVILIGVYPAIRSDAAAQYNAIEWQTEVIKTGIPYMVYDNNLDMVSTTAIHQTINNDIAEAMQLITGHYYGNHVTSMIDNRDFYMMLSHAGKRITVATSTERPSVNQSLDDYVERMLQTCHQPVPKNVSAIGIFVRGPREFMDKLDTSLPAIRNTYGDAIHHYIHIEEDKEIRISFIAAGSDEPEDRLFMMKDRYDDIMNNGRATQNVSDGMLGEMFDPNGDISTNVRTERKEQDLSALDL